MFTVTVGPASTMVAPWPLEIVMPTSLTMIIAPVTLFSRMPPAGPGTSLIAMAFCSPDCSTTLGLAGLPASASAGTSAALPQKPPTQTG